MKFSILALGAAFASISCACPCVAQFSGYAAPSAASTELRPDSPAPATQAQPNFIGGRYLPQLAPVPGTSEPAISLPSTPVLTSPAMSAPAMSASGASDAVIASGAPSDGSRDLRKSLPVTKMGAPIESLPTHLVAVLEQTGEVGIVPVVWPQGPTACATPNPVSHVLMQNGCTAGLWATHAAQQECHCHRIQAIIHGHHQVNRYTAGKSAHVCSNCQATQGAHQFTSTATPRDGMHTNGPVILGQTSGGPTNPQAMSSVPAGAPTAVQVAPLDTSRLGPPPGIATEHGQNPVIAAPALPAVVAPPATPAEPVPFVAPTPEFPADLPSLPSLPPPPAGGGTMPAPLLPALPAFEDPMPAPAQPGTAGPTSPLPDAPMQSSDSLVAMRAKKNLR